MSTCRGNGCGQAGNVIVRKGTIEAGFCRIHAEYYAEHPQLGFEIISGAETLIVRTEMAACERCGRHVGHNGMAAHNTGSGHTRRPCR